MSAKSWSVLQGLLHSFHGDDFKLFEKFLPEEGEGKEIFSSFLSPKAEKSEIFLFSKGILGGMHYSWLFDLFEKIPEEKRALYFSSIPEEQDNENMRVLKDKFGEKISLTEFGRKFLFSHLQHMYLEKEDWMPFALLPDSHFKDLLRYGKRKLVRFIDFLGIRDLSIELRELNSPEVSQRIEEILTMKKREYLKICLEEEALRLSSLELIKWDGDKRKMQILLHQKGLERFAKTISGQHLSFFWHITRKLDKGRGKALMKHYSKEEIPDATPVLSRQFASLVEFLEEM